MKEMDDKKVCLLSIQVISFIFLLLFSLSMDRTPITLIGLLCIEALIFIKLQSNLQTMLVLWQAQVFLVALVGLTLYPATFLNTTEVSLALQVFLIAALILVEAIIALIYRYSERAIVWALKGSTISLLCIVLLILAMVGSDGFQGFMENDPADMLTSTSFNAMALPTYSIPSELTTQVLPYNVTVVASDSVMHMCPDSDKNLTVTIQNTGALSDTYNVSFGSDSGISYIPGGGDQNITIPAGGQVDLNGTVRSTATGDFTLNVVVGGESNISKETSVLIDVSTDGLEFTKDHAAMQVQAVTASQGSVPLGLVNMGGENRTCVLRISAPSIFTPFLDVPSWDFTTRSAVVVLSPGEQLNFSFVPLLLTAVKGEYTLVLSVYPEDGSQPIDTFTLDFTNVGEDLILPQHAGPIPVYPGTTTHWNITINDPGWHQDVLKLSGLPAGLTITAIRNGSEPIAVVGGGSTIYLDTDGRANVEFLVSTNDGKVGDVSSIKAEVVRPGSQLTFGMLGFIAGSFLTTSFAIILAAPAGLGCAIFLSQYCQRRSRSVIKPIMEILIGIPSVIFGLWGALTFAPMLGDTLYPVINDTLGSAIPFFSGSYELGRDVMTASIVLAIMIFPLVMALSYEAMMAVPADLKDASLSLGATKWQTVRRIVLGKARTGIMGAVILAIGRALGETMAVLMIMYYSPNVPSSIFSGGSTMTSAIATNFATVYANEAARHGLFSVALLLFLLVLVLNYVLMVVTKDSFWAALQKRTERGRRVLTGLWGRRRGRAERTVMMHADGNMATQVRSSFRSSQRLNRHDRFITVALYALALLMIGFVAYIIGDIVIRGGLALQLEYLTETQLSGGGFLNSILGSLMLVGIAVLIAVPITLMAAIYVNEYTVSGSRLGRLSYLAVSTLSSTPSIVFGAFGFLLFVIYMGFGFSLLAGGLTLAFMIVPILYISNFEAIRSVPETYREASYALGVSKWRTVRGVVLPSSLPTISSGIILGVGRAIGETAAILLTASFAMFITTSVTEPVASMPVAIYTMYDLSAGNPAMMGKVYAAAFILIAMVLVLNLIGKAISHHYSDATRR